MTLADVLAIVRLVFDQYYHNLLATPNPEDPHELREIGTRVARIQTAIRFTTWEMSEVQTFWDYIREHEASTDFILGCTSEFYARYVTTDGVPCVDNTYGKSAWGSLIDVLANALYIPRATGTNSDYMVDDADHYNRGFDVVGWRLAMSSNAWLVWVYLLKLADIKLIATPAAAGTVTWNRVST